VFKSSAKNLVAHGARIVTKNLYPVLFEFLKQWDQLRDKDMNTNTIAQRDLQCAKMIETNLLNRVSVWERFW